MMPAFVDAAVTDVCDTFDAAGLTTHEQVVSRECAKTLGTDMELVRKRTMLTRKRFWRTRQAVNHVLRRNATSGQALEIVLGHMTFCGLLERGSLCVFNAVYAFTRKHYYVTTILWPEVRQELTTYLGLMPLLAASWSLPWSPHVSATDSSLEGYGVCVGSFDKFQVGEIGRTFERSRFRLDAGASAPDAFFESNGFCKLPDGQWVARRDTPEGPVASRWSQVSAFPEIDLEILQNNTGTCTLHSCGFCEMMEY